MLDGITRRAFNPSDAEFAVIDGLFSVFTNLNAVGGLVAMQTADPYNDPITPWDHTMFTLKSFISELGFSDEFAHRVYNKWAEINENAEFVMDSVIEENIYKI